MHGSNRGKGIAAVAGVALLFITFGLGLYVGALNYPEQQRYQPYRYASDKPAEIDPTLPAGQVGAQPQEYRSPCSNPKGHDESDLCAQWRAAKAGEDSAFWAKWGFWIGLGGMIGLFWTLYYTRMAVEDTGHATDAMRESNAIAENAQRPWIKMTAQLIDVELIERRAIVLGWQITFTNVGGMVAENFQPVVKFAAMGSDFLERMNEIMNSFPGSLEEIDSVLIPNDENWWRGSAGQAIEYLPWENRLGFRKDCRLVLVAMVRYRIPGQTKWRFSMQGFVIAENISHIDDATFRYDFPDDLSLKNMHIRKLGRSRAT